MPPVDLLAIPACGGLHGKPSCQGVHYRKSGGAFVAQEAEATLRRAKLPGGLRFPHVPAASSISARDGQKLLIFGDSALSSSLEEGKSARRVAKFIWEPLRKRRPRRRYSHRCQLDC